MANLTCPNPASINPLTLGGFMLSVEKLPLLSFFSQTVALPAITLGQADQASPFVSVPVPGDKLEYDPLTVEFMIDENLTNYLAIQDWLVGLGFPDNNDEYANFIDNQFRPGASELSKGFSDGVMTILSPSNLPVKQVFFKDLFPISLSIPSPFTTTSTETQNATGIVTFKYTSYSF